MKGGFIMIKEIDSSNFKKEISKGKVLIEAFGTWCSPCRQLAPIVEDLSNEINDIKFYKLDVDKSADIAQQYEVMGIPTLILFKDGKEIKRIVGFKPKEELKKELK